MKTIEIKGRVRPTQGKVSSRTIRNAGDVPCEVYGKENVHIQIDARELGKVVYSPEVFKVNLQIDGKSYDTVMREIQFHPVSDNILHVDFEQVDDNKVYNIDIPVKYVGNPVGVVAGGKLKTNARKMNVKGPIKNIPEFIEINIAHLNIGDSIRVKDLKFNGMTITEAPNNVIASVMTSRVVVDTPVDKPVTSVAAAPAAAAKPAEGGAAAKPAEAAKPAKK